MNGKVSLRARLIAAFAAIVVGALTLAAVFGVIRFDKMISEQAQTSSDTSLRVAISLLADEVSSVREAVAETAEDDMLDLSSSTIGADLAHRADLAGLNYLAVVTPSGSVRATSLGATQYDTGWEQLRTWCSQRQPVHGLIVVPQSELDQLGLAEALQLEPKATPNGTIVEGEEQGALAVIAITPFGEDMLVGARIMKLRYQLVDSVVEKMGGTATVFQHGVRISTTVKNDEGERAIGTIVSDQVRAATLDRGEPYKGEAFVVNREYLAAYEPLRDINNNVVGMLYVGVDKAPYAAATRAFALTFGAVVLVALALALFGAVRISRSLTSPLEAMSGAAAQVSTGDLTTRVPAQGYQEIRELGDSFNRMTAGLKTIIAQVDDSVRRLRNVSGEISSASRSSSEHATRQATSVAQTTATLEELTRSFQAVADGARHVLHVAEDALESAQGGVATVDRAHDSMDQLAAGAKDMSAAAGAMNEVASEITEMTDMIGGIAGQTKILALNAAIEAARAGEAGKGFAVVSSEIRALADNVAESAARIADMVTGIQEASERFQQAAARQSSLSDSTIAARQESRVAFGLIVQQMEDTAHAAREIAEATVQQTRASDQLVEVMHQVSLSSSETAAAARQLAESANSVELEAGTLLDGLTRFKTV